jgi:hypothetical protein
MNALAIDRRHLLKDGDRVHHGSVKQGV